MREGFECHVLDSMQYMKPDETRILLALQEGQHQCSILIVDTSELTRIDANKQARMRTRQQTIARQQQENAQDIAQTAF